MARRTQRTRSPALKSKVATAALKGEKTLAELAQQYDLHANQITEWAQLADSAAALLGAGDTSVQAAPTVGVARLLEAVEFATFDDCRPHQRGRHTGAHCLRRHLPNAELFAGLARSLQPAGP